QIFDMLLEEDSYPLVFHCTAGKDRTGLLSALILSALEVPQDVIFNEYLLSNYFRYDKIERNAKLGAWILGIDPVASRSIMDVRNEYLASSFEAIEREYGSLDRYFNEALDLTQEDLARLRELLLY
ncbi:MAG: tyrosine-protein phosphatase, partial [Bacteroidota bacterium]